MIDEGCIKFVSHWRRSPALTHPEIDELIRWRVPLYRAGLIGHFADIDVGYGNLSVRVGEMGPFVISGTQTGHRVILDREHFALVTAVDLDRNAVFSEGAAEASSESMTHATLYDLDPEIRAVVHIHSQSMWIGLRNRAPTTDAGVAYGTPEMASEFRRLFDETEFSESGIAVMAGHDGGLVSIGNSVQEAAERLLSLHNEG